MDFSSKKMATVDISGLTTHYFQYPNIVLNTPNFKGEKTQCWLEILNFLERVFSIASCPGL